MNSESPEGFLLKMGRLKRKISTLLHLLEKSVSSDATEALYAELLEEAAHFSEIVQISWEATPSSSVSLLPWLISAGFSAQTRYLSAILQALETDSEGNDVISRRLGLKIKRVTYGYSAWQGNVGAGAQSFVEVSLENPRNRDVSQENGQENRENLCENRESLLAETRETQENREGPAETHETHENREGFTETPRVREDFRRKLAQYCAILGVLLRQDAVLWFLKTPARVNSRPGLGIEAEFHWKLSGKEFEDAYHAIYREFRTWNLAPGFTPEGFLVVNYEENLDNFEFYRGMLKVFEELRAKNVGKGLKNNGIYELAGEYIGNDWNRFPQGEKYREIIEKEEGLWEWTERVLAEKIEKVNERFNEGRIIEDH